MEAYMGSYMEAFVDLRKLNKKELFELRKKVVSLKEKGHSGKEIERQLRVRSNRVSEIWRSYLNNGIEGLKPGAPGRKPGEKALISPDLEHEIKRIITENTPDRLEMPYSLWTLQIASEFIRREYSIKVSVRSMTNYFKKWGFICKPPMKRDDFRNSRECMVFLEEGFPAIVKRAASENVGIYWFCETQISKEPEQHKGIHQEGIKMAAAVTARGTARFTFFNGRKPQKEFIVLMDRLIRYADRKVFFIVEDANVFRGKEVRAWLESCENRIEVFYYPASAAARRKSR